MFRPERVFTDCEEVASQLSDVTLLDLRRAEDFAMGHIAGAKHLDLYGGGLSNTAPELGRCIAQTSSIKIQVFRARNMPHGKVFGAA